MIWLCIGFIVLITLILISHPLLSTPADPEKNNRQNEVYFSKIEELNKRIEIEGDENQTLLSKKIELQRTILKGSERPHKESLIHSMIVFGSLFVTFTFGMLGIYSILGQPISTGNITANSGSRSVAQQDLDAMREDQASLQQMVTNLRLNLDANPNSLDGWLLYARSLMNLGRFTEAFGAYERVLELSENNAEILPELQRAKEFASQRTGIMIGPQNGTSSIKVEPGPTREDIEMASKMSSEDQQQMILGMVEGLAAKLSEAPDDPNGWIRLLRSRKVLGQTNEMKADINNLKKIYSDDPATIEMILRNSN